MYLTTLIKHPHVNSNHLMIIVYKIHYLIQSKSVKSRKNSIFSKKGENGNFDWKSKIF